MTAATMANLGYSSAFFDQFEQNYGKKAKSPFKKAFSEALGEGGSPLESVGKALAKPLNWFKGLWNRKQELLPQFGAATASSVAVAGGLGLAAGNFDTGLQANSPAGINDPYRLAKESSAPTAQPDILAPLIVRTAQKIAPPAPILAELRVSPNEKPLRHVRSFPTTLPKFPENSGNAQYKRKESIELAVYHGAAQPPPSELRSSKNVQRASAPQSFFGEQQDGPAREEITLVPPPAPVAPPVPPAPTSSTRPANPVVAAAAVLPPPEAPLQAAPAITAPPATAPHARLVTPPPVSAAPQAPASQNITAAPHPAPTAAASPEITTVPAFDMTALPLGERITKLMEGVNRSTLSKKAQNELNIAEKYAARGNAPWAALNIAYYYANAKEGVTEPDYARAWELALLAKEIAMKGGSQTNLQTANKFLNDLQMLWNEAPDALVSAYSTAAVEPLPPRPVARPFPPKAPAQAETKIANAAGLPPIPAPRPVRTADKSVKAKPALATAAAPSIIHQAPLAPPNGATAAPAPASHSMAPSSMTVTVGGKKVRFTNPEGKPLTQAEVELNTKFVRDSDPAVALAFANAAMPTAPIATAPANDDKPGFFERLLSAAPLDENNIQSGALSPEHG